MRKSFIAFVLALLIAMPLPASSEEWTWSGTPGNDGNYTIELWEDFRSQASSLSRELGAGRTPPFGESRVCRSITRGACAEALDGTRDSFGGTYIAPVCEKASDENCIEWVSIHTESEPAVKASLLGSVEGGQLPKLEKYRLPRGGTTSLWQQPGQVNGGGVETYAVALRMDLKYEHGARPHAYFGITGYSLQVMPYFEKNGDYAPHSCDEFTQDGRTFVGCGGLPEECAWSGVGVCGRHTTFPESTKVTISFRIDSTASGWFAGRVGNPDISITKLRSNQVRVQISGEPAEVPVARGTVSAEAAPSQMRREFRNCLPVCWNGIFAGSDQAVKVVPMFTKAFGDRATFTRDMWSIRSLQDPKAQRCASGNTGLLGIVATNAMAYQSQPPQYQRGFLDYKVVGMHYLPDGTTQAIGRYDLVMRSDVARCIYGFQKAPISATITVVDAEGDRQLATTTVGERNGWLKLSARGFTFSEKTIKVKLTQPKRTTITCVAPGKRNVKVTSVSPKCPKGFKKR